jgi:hypothetical protein
MARETNIMITYKDARDMVTIEGYTFNDVIPNSNVCMNKVEIETYLFCDISGTYANNQLVPYNRISKRTPPTPSTTAFTMSSNPRSTSSSACRFGNLSATRYHEGAGGTPVINDVVYTNILATTTLNGENKWFYTQSDTSIRINTAGVVTAFEFCTVD